MRKLERNRVFNTLYWTTIPFILINAFIFVWQLSRIYPETNDRMAHICFSLMIIGSFILVVTLLIQFIIFVRRKIRSREVHPRDRLIPSIRHSISITKQKSIPKAGKLRMEDQRQRFYNRFGSYEKELQLSSQAFPVSMDEKVIVISLDSLIYDEEILHERCGVCKLTFITNQVVVFCPNCENLFHKEHLSEWLKQKPYCPVCSYNFSSK